MRNKNGSEPKREKGQTKRLKDGDEKMKENLYLDYEKKAISKVGNERQSFGANYAVDPHYAEKQKPGEPPYERCVQ